MIIEDNAKMVRIRAIYPQILIIGDPMAEILVQKSSKSIKIPRSYRDISVEKSHLNVPEFLKTRWLHARRNS